MQSKERNELARAIADGLKCTNGALCCEVVRQLAIGEPLPPERLATTLKSAPQDVIDDLHTMPDIEFDDGGRVLGCGLTLVPTRHRFTIHGKTLYTWCAFDTLMYPALLGQTAQVSSQCRATNGTITLTVSPNGIRDLSPPTAVISIVPPRTGMYCQGATVRCARIPTKTVR